jgi:hypothetical protein
LCPSPKLDRPSPWRPSDFAAVLHAIAGRIGTAEALRRTTLENAGLFLLDQKYLVEQEKKLSLGPAMQSAEARAGFASELRQYLNRRKV